MNDILLIFLTMLFILTVMSAIGGGIRVRENFYDELYNQDMGMGNFEFVVPAGATDTGGDAPVDVPAEDEVVAAPAPPAPTASPIPSSDAAFESAPGEFVIEPFDGGLYAPAK